MGGPRPPTGIWPTIITLAEFLISVLFLQADFFSQAQILIEMLLVQGVFVQTRTVLHLQLMLSNRIA